MKELTVSKRKTKTAKMSRCKRDPAKPCRHLGVVYTYHPDTDLALSCRCSPTFGCGAQLSLGPSNDLPRKVRVEMRAAELDLWYSADDLSVGDFSPLERDGWSMHCTHGDLVGTLSTVIADHVEAGWLACETAMHDGRDMRDADAWSWDTSQPIADQKIEEKLSRLAEQTRHDVAASVVRHAMLNGPEDPSVPLHSPSTDDLREVHTSAPSTDAQAAANITALRDVATIPPAPSADGVLPDTNEAGHTLESEHPLNSDGSAGN